MLPSLVARDIEKGLKSYIKNEFPIASAGFQAEDGKSVLDAFLDEPESLTKGPWVEVKLPFRQSGSGEALPFVKLPITTIIPGFTPYAHQRKAFERLCGTGAQSTLIATGTGSGKTECFLLPILDYCLASDKKGIKAILIYPMNALATDQAKRVASLVENLQTAGEKKVSVGIYTGESKSWGNSELAPGLMENREAIRKNPPDILLTNYKMLDFLLMRPEDQSLWEGNGPDILRYLVVDELHTFDGAQGTDLACLIRRLRDRLALTDSLACVGTSATLGGPESLQDLCRYAASVFGTNFDAEFVITEDRLTADEYLPDIETSAPLGHWPNEELLGAERTDPASRFPKLETYFSQVIPLWFDKSLGFDGGPVTDEARIELGKALPRLAAFQKLVHDVQGVTALKDIIFKWDREVDDFRNLGLSPDERKKLVTAAVDSLLAMVSEARIEANGRVLPFLSVRSQLWMRTLSRAVVSVSHKPQLALANDLPALTNPLWLPVVGCRECNNTAWATTISGGIQSGGQTIQPNLSLFYQSWFTEGRDTVLLYPVTEASFYESHRSRMFRVCAKCGVVTSLINKTWDKAHADTDCPCGSTDTVIVWVPDTNEAHQKNGAVTYRFNNRCPHCLAGNSLRIFGAGSATLSAAAVDHLNSSGFNEDHKVIAFSDSVQDAALRAGFLDARNYLPTCRHALVHYVNRKIESHPSIPLRQIVREIASFWVTDMTAHYQGENQALLGEAAFLATFMPPDKTWRDAWRAFSDAAESSRAGDVTELVSTRPIWDRLFNDVKERLVWETLLELGFRSENGRTVARTRSVIAFPSTSAIERTVRELVPLFTEQLGIVTTEQTLRSFVTGLINRLRLTGAFDVQDFKSLGAESLQRDFGNYLESGHDFVAYNRSLVLPAVGQKFRAPTAVTLVSDNKDRFNVSLTSNRHDTWFEQWVLKLFTHDAVLLSPSQVQDILLLSLKALEKTKLVRSFTRQSGDRAWVLPTQSWSVGKNMKVWRCSHCGRRYFTAGDKKTSELWIGMPCLSVACRGMLAEADADEGSNLYDAPPVRINAREHTAIIDSDDRHKIETNFSTTDDRWSVNLLSATPTLEMGIDIGNLSTVLLCSVPPSEASFLQRIGRAGRRDGNALALTLADRSPHDQYFWQDPTAMLAGDVTTPGVFLKAVSVLERQLTAFALGLWVRETGSKVKLDRLRDAVANLTAQKTDAFPLAFLSWVSSNRERLYARFTALFTRGGADELNPYVRGGLKAFLTGTGERPSLVVRVRSALEYAKQQTEDLQRKRDGIRKRVADLKGKPQDEARQNETESLTQQQTALTELIKSSDKSLWQFFTDEGLLPNYAFPEEGVQVKSVIIKRRGSKDTEAASGSKAPSRVETFEFARSAAAALRDLAPASRFYANSHILHVDQVNLTKESFEAWRLCPACAHMERVDATQPAPEQCPRCGNAMFGDLGSVKTLLRVRELTAVADAKTDRIDDSKDDRQHEPMANHLFIEVEPKNIAAAWRFKDENFTFGFEFVRRVTVREINFGSKAAAGSGTPFMAAGLPFPQTGFAVCRHCGKVRLTDKSREQHDPNCPCYGKPDNPKQSPWVEGFFLYREMESEAVRLRVPVCDMIDAAGADIGTQSLIAALELGLRRYFKGAVDHLAVTLQTEPVPESPNARNRYIVIYDTIPGGSGYLKELAQSDKDSEVPSVIMKLFTEAWEAVRNCRCTQDPAKDGCYHCVYHYRDFASRRLISRREAENLLQRIAAHRPSDIEPINTISALPTLDMSALENLMVKRLSEIPGAIFSSRPTKTGEIYWELTVPVSAEAEAHWSAKYGVKTGNRFTWLLKAQKDVRGEHPSRPDFMLTPLSDTLAAKDPALTAYIFTDGWEFHAKTLTEDTQKRQSLMNEGFRVWSLTWQDLQCSTNQPRSAAYGDTLPVASNLKQAASFWRGVFAKKAPGIDPVTFAQNRLTNQQTSWDWLTAWLLDPCGFSDSMRAAIQYAAFSQVQRPAAAPAAGDFSRYPAPLTLAQQGKIIGWLPGAHPLPSTVWAATLGQNGEAFFIAAALRIRAADFADKRVTEDDKQHKAWARFWQTANAQQFLTRSWICTEANEIAPVNTHGYESRDVVRPSQPETAGLDADWAEWLQELTSDPEFFVNLQPAARAMAQKHLPVPDDLVDGCNNCVFCSGQAFLWDKKDRPVLFVAAEDLTPDVHMPDENKIALVTTSAPDWLQTLETLLTH